jgi:hypothetical protein
MPDDLDYAWLGWLIEHPDKWTPADLATAGAVIADQKRAVDESHPKDTRGRDRKQAIVDALESAIQEHLGRPAL